MVEIKTDRLVIREFEIDDISNEYVHALNDIEVVGLTEARHSSWDKNSVIEYVKNCSNSDDCMLLGIFIIENGSHIGNIRLSSITNIHKRCDLGIMIWDKGMWGKGYGSESLKAVCNFVFRELGLRRICADYYKTNSASAKMFEKAGFTIEGEYKDHFQLNGEYIDSVRIALMGE